MRIIWVPRESVPAIKGLKGCKIQDIESRSMATIDVEKLSKEPLVEVSISGGNEKLAEDLIIHAVKHYLASQLPLPLNPDYVDDKTVALYDLQCFYFEMFSMAA